MPDYLGDAKKKTVCLKCSFFCFLRKLVELKLINRDRWCEYKSKPSYQMSGSKLNKESSDTAETKSKKWQLWGKAVCEEGVRWAYIPVFVKDKTDCGEILMQMKWQQ